MLGSIEANHLGVTSVHEHLLTDARSLYRPGVEHLNPDQPVTPDLAVALRWSQLAVRDNLVLSDTSVIAHELARVIAVGQSTVVECTSLGLGPDHGKLPMISQSSGVNVVASYGAYFGPDVPTWYRERNGRERQELFERALSIAIPGVRYRAGMLGLMGTTSEFSRDERISLAAAARAAARFGAAVSIRLDPNARNGLKVLELCVGEGMSPNKVIFANVGRTLDIAYIDDLGGAGAVLEMCFGNDGRHLGRLGSSSDFDRLEFLANMLVSRREIRWALGTGLWTKGQLRCFGGHGYDHLLTRVIPALRTYGVTDDCITRMLIDVPAELLDRK